MGTAIDGGHSYGMHIFSANCVTSDLTNNRAVYAATAGQNQLPESRFLYIITQAENEQVIKFY